MPATGPAAAEKGSSGEPTRNSTFPLTQRRHHKRALLTLLQEALAAPHKLQRGSSTPAMATDGRSSVSKVQTTQNLRKKREIRLWGSQRSSTAGQQRKGTHDKDELLQRLTSKESRGVRLDGDRADGLPERRRRSKDTVSKNGWGNRRSTKNKAQQGLTLAGEDERRQTHRR